MIYQFDNNLVLIAKYETISAASNALSIPRATISHACRQKQNCRGLYYFSKEQVMVKKVPKVKIDGKKFSVMVNPETWEEFLSCIGQRNKQDVFRELLKNWIKSENDKHRVSAGN
jgi:hypothetical protein